jgi:hypothetical protein
MEVKNAYSILVMTSEVERPLGKKKKKKREIEW